MRREGDRGWATCQDYKAGVQRFRRFSFALTIARELGPGSHFPVSKSWVKDVAPGRLRLLCRCPPGSEGVGEEAERGCLSQGTTLLSQEWDE